MLPDKDALSTFGQPRNNRIPITDPSTDIGAEHWNPLTNDVAMLSVLGDRAWAAFHWTGAAMVLDAHDEMWNGVSGYTVPTLARTGAGVYTVTYPATTFDFIPSSNPSGGGSHTINLRSAHGYVRPGGAASVFTVECSASGNVVTVNLKVGGTVTDSNNLVIEFKTF